MRKSVLLFFFIFISLPSIAQQLSGKILDEENLPLYGATVYFDGTTIGTTTDENGYFELNLKTFPNGKLIISHVGYETVYLDEFISPISLSLQPTAIALNEVVLEPIPFSRKELIKAFREQFLGKSSFAKKCRIVNEEVIQFAYINKDFKLSAFATDKIKIRNEELGYDIEVELITFDVFFTKRKLNDKYLKSSYFAVYSFFKELEGIDKSIVKNRESAYLGSSRQFFSNLLKNKWGSDDFLLVEGRKALEPKKHFEISKQNEWHLIRLKLDKSEEATFDAKSFLKRFNVVYQKKSKSIVYFKTPEFTVDSFGNHSHHDQIYFSGELSKKRFGDMLPLDYSYRSKK